MKRIYIPRDVLAGEIRAGRLTTGGGGFGGAVGGAAAAIAATGLKNAAEGSGRPDLQFPPRCCNCLAEGPSVRPTDCVSVVNRGVAYTFKLPVPHCPGCQDTANRTRPGFLGLFAVLFASSILIGIGVAIAGAALGRSTTASVAFLVGPIAGILVTVAVAKARRPKAGQASAHQAVFASGVDLEFSGALKGAQLTFANDAYADQFVTVNRKIGVTAR